MTELFLPPLTLSGWVFPFYELHDHGWHILPFSIISKCVIIFHVQYKRDWLVPATFDSQRVRIPISRAVPSQLTYSPHLCLSASAWLYLMSSTIMADLFLPLMTLMTLSGCVIPFHELHHHGLHVLAIFDYQQVRICISWAVKSWLTNCVLPLLTLSGCVLPFHELHHHGLHVPAILIIRKCVFIFHELHNHGWHVSVTSDSQWVRNFISWASPSRLTFSIIRKCVFIFHEQHGYSWLVPATFDSQWVRNHISWAAPSRLTCSCHFRFISKYVFYILCAAQSWLTCSCHFWLSAGAYSHFMSCTIMHHGLYVPAIFDYQEVRIIFHKRHNHG